MAQEAAVHVVVADLDDPLGGERDELLLARPGSSGCRRARCAGRAPRVVGGVDLQRAQLDQQLAPARHRERGRSRRSGAARRRTRAHGGAFSPSA